MGVAKPGADPKYCLAELYETLEGVEGQAKLLFREAAELYSHALGKDNRQTNEAFERADAAHTDAASRRMSIG